MKWFAGPMAAFRLRKLYSKFNSLKPVLPGPTKLHNILYFLKASLFLLNICWKWNIHWNVLLLKMSILCFLFLCGSTKPYFFTCKLFFKVLWLTVHTYYENVAYWMCDTKVHWDSDAHFAKLKHWCFVSNLFSCIYNYIMIQREFGL